MRSRGAIMLFELKSVFQNEGEEKVNSGQTDSDLHLLGK